MTPREMAAIHAASFTTPRPWSETEIRDLLGTPRVFCIDTQTGFAIGRCVAEEAELLTIAIAPEARRRGEGRKLLRAFLHNAADLGAKSCFLEVASDNTAACALYRAAQFEQVGKRKDYYRRPDGSRVAALVFRHTFPATS